MLRRAAIAFGVLAVTGAIVAVAVNGVGSGAVGNSGGRIGSTSSNFRFTWWSQAWHGFTDHVLCGYRRRVVPPAEPALPHDVPRLHDRAAQPAGADPRRARACRARALRALLRLLLLRGSLRRSGHELALALLLPAFLVHSLVDVDWDFVAVAAPAFVAAGALVGRPVERRLRGFSLLPALGVALIVLGSLTSPWLARRWVERGRGRLTGPRDHAREPRARARSVPARAVLGQGRRRGHEARGLPRSYFSRSTASRRTRCRGCSPVNSR